MELTERNFSSYFHPLRPFVEGVKEVEHLSSPMMSIASEIWNNETIINEQALELANSSAPIAPTFNNDGLTVVIVYCILFAIAAVGNLTVFITLFKSRRRKSRISLMITHLAIADLLVTFVTIPFEVRTIYNIIIYT